MAIPKVFISYAHDIEQFANKVLEFSKQVCPTKHIHTKVPGYTRKM